MNHIANAANDQAQPSLNLALLRPHWVGIVPGLLIGLIVPYLLIAVI